MYCLSAEALVLIKRIIWARSSVACLESASLRAEADRAGVFIVYYVYVLKSDLDNHFYTGQTKDIDARLSLHNSGKVNSTKRYKPWKIVYYEKYITRNEAVKREKHLKSRAGRKWLKQIDTGP